MHPEEKAIKKRQCNREKKLNDSLPISTPRRSPIYIIKIHITRRMNGEPSGGENCLDGKREHKAKDKTKSVG